MRYDKVYCNNFTEKRTRYNSVFLKCLTKNSARHNSVYHNNKTQNSERCNSVYHNQTQNSSRYNVVFVTIKHGTVCAITVAIETIKHRLVGVLSIRKDFFFSMQIFFIILTKTF